MANSRYVLASPTPDQILRLAEIQTSAFMQDPLTVGAFPNVSPADRVTFWDKSLRQLLPPSGYRSELVCAMKKETGEVVGFAQWAIPTPDGVGDAAAPPPIPLPVNADAQVWAEFFEGIERCEKEVMGDKKHWTLILLAVDPTFNRQGAGRALVQWGVERAASTNLPVFICASEQGERLYSALGFTVRKREHVTSKHILTTHMLKDPVAPDSDL